MSDIPERLTQAAAEAKHHLVATSARMQLDAAVRVIDDLARQIDRLRAERDHAERELRHQMGRP